MPAQEESASIMDLANHKQCTARSHGEMLFNLQGLKLNMKEHRQKFGQTPETFPGFQLKHRHQVMEHSTQVQLELAQMLQRGPKHHRRNTLVIAL